MNEVGENIGWQGGSGEREVPHFDATQVDEGYRTSGIWHMERWKGS